MTETVVHVETSEQWKSVLNVWFRRGYAWRGGNKGHEEHIFENGGRYLFLEGVITWSGSNSNYKPAIEYVDFMSQQKEDEKMTTYYVTQEQLDLIEDLKSLPAPLVAIMNKKYEIEILYNELPLSDIEWFSYLSGDDKIELKKEQLYRLWRVNNAENKVYMDFNLGTPGWTLYKEYAFTAPLEEIKKHKTISWEIEEVK